MLYRMNTSNWSVERAMFLLGGILVILFGILTLTTDSRFIYGDIFVGIMFSIFALTGYCPGAIIAAKIMKK